MYKTLEDYVGNTPLVRLKRLPGAASDARGNLVLAKLEGNNPAGSVKDRPALVDDLACRDAWRDQAR
jgi:cysteine synthase B